MRVLEKAPLFQALAVKVHRVYRNSALRRWRFWLKGKRLPWMVYLTGVSLIIGGVLEVHSYLYSFYQVVLVDEQEIGLVRESEEVEEFVNSLAEKCSNLYRMPVTPLEKITCCREYRPDGEADLQLVKDTLRQQITMVTEAVMVTVDGQPVVPVKNKQEVDGVIDLLCQSYASRSEGVKLLEVKLTEEIEGENCLVKPEDICSAEGVVGLLARGGHNRELYTISRGTTPHNLAELPPDDDLPEVHVVTVEEIGLEEDIPFATRRLYSSSLRNGQSKVTSPGKPGTKQVVYHVTRENGQEIARQKISETILEHPVTQIVEKGTAQVPSCGTGQFIWPIPYNVDHGGRITQGFRGYAHRGIDISSSAGTSTPIIAADSGVVVRAGSRGSLGNYIIIYHGRYYTVYMHTSRNLVSNGEVVNKGQTIAYMGSTGRSTGVHLHFEIRKSNGSGQWTGWDSNPPVDPLSFFSP